MAFIRRKKVHGYEYYQAVRNYRDSNGKHRQEFLCHLSKHNSLEAAIAAERTAAKIDRERTFLRGMRERALYATIEDYYPDRAEWVYVYCEEDIPGLLNELCNQRSEYEHYLAKYGHKEYELAIEELDMALEFLEMCLKLCAAEALVAEAMQRARGHEEKLEKYLQVKRKHF